MTKFYRFVLRAFRWILYAFFFLKVENKEYIPTDRNFIILSNHVSAWDPFTIAVSGKFHFRPMAKQELYRFGPIGFILRKLGCIKVDRTDGVRALALARRALLNKEVMLIFPEGTRSVTRQLLDFKAGAFALSVKTKTPVLPCQVISPKGMRLFRRVRVRYGPLIGYEELDLGSDDKDYAKAMTVVRDAFIRLRGDEMPD